MAIEATNFSALNVGDRRTLPGTDLYLIRKGTFTHDPGSLTTNLSAEQTATITGAVLGDLVLLIPPADLEALTVGQAHVSAANTVKFMLANVTGGTIDGASKTWGYVLIRF